MITQNIITEPNEMQTITGVETEAFECLEYVPQCDPIQWPQRPGFPKKLSRVNLVKLFMTGISPDKLLLERFSVVSLTQLVNCNGTSPDKLLLFSISETKLCSSPSS